jgi:hypothetical protein
LNIPAVSPGSAASEIHAVNNPNLEPLSSRELATQKKVFSQITQSPLAKGSAAQSSRDSAP